MRLRACGILSAVLLVSQTASGREWRFDDGPDGFPEASDGNRWIAGVDSGVYRVRVCKPFTTFMAGPSETVSGNFRLEADLRYAHACWWDTYGLIFSPTPDFSRYYQVKWIEGDLGCQRYQVVKREGEKNTDLFDDWIFPLYLFNGGNEWNHWRIERRAGRLSFWLKRNDNYDFLFEVTDYDHWDAVYLGVLVSTFENSCDGSVNDNECVQGTEVHFDNITVETLAADSACRRAVDCPTGEWCDDQTSTCQSGPPLSSWGTPGVTIEPSAPRAGQDATLLLVDGANKILVIRDPVGTWVTPTWLGPEGEGVLYGLPDLKAGTYEIEVSSGRLPEHASDCGDGRNNDPFVELVPVGRVRLSVSPN